MEIPSTDICPQRHQTVWKRPFLPNSTNPPNNRTTEQQNNRTTEQQNNSMEAAIVTQLNKPA